MPLPTPSKDESHAEFMDRCMSHEMMMKEYPDQKQRAAICQKQSKMKEIKSFTQEIERRVIGHAKQELRVEETDGKTRISGLAVPYGETSEDLGGFREIFQAGAFGDTLTENREVFADVEHDGAKKLGRRSRGTLDLRDTPEGLRFSVSIPTTTLGKDTVEEVRSGLLDGVSIAFSDADSQWIGHGADTIRKIAKATLNAVTLTSYPAYRQTIGTLTMRSLEAHREAEELAAAAAVATAEAEKQPPIALLREQLDAIETD